MTEPETSKQRSAVRSAVLDVLAGAPPEGLAVAAIMVLANVVSRDAVDHLLHRMVKAGDVQRRGRGRYVLAGTLQRQTALAAPTPPHRQIGPPATGAAPTQRTSEPPAIRPEPAHQARAEVPMVEKLGDAATICRALGKAWDDARFGPERPADTWDNDREAVAVVWASRSVSDDRRDPKRPATPAELDAFCAKVGCLCAKVAEPLSCWPVSVILTDTGQPAGAAKSVVRVTATPLVVIWRPRVAPVAIIISAVPKTKADPGTEAVTAKTSAEAAAAKTSEAAAVEISKAAAVETSAEAAPMETSASAASEC